MIGQLYLLSPLQFCDFKVCFCKKKNGLNQVCKFYLQLICTSSLSDFQINGVFFFLNLQTKVSLFVFVAAVAYAAALPTPGQSNQINPAALPQPANGPLQGMIDRAAPDQDMKGSSSYGYGYYGRGYGYYGYPQYYSSYGYPYYYNRFYGYG